MQATIIKAKKGINVRIEPRKDAPVVRIAETGSTVSFDRMCAGWCHVADGWCMADFLDTGEPERPEDGATQPEDTTPADTGDTNPPADDGAEQDAIRESLNAQSKDELKEIARDEYGIAVKSNWNKDAIIDAILAKM